MSIAFVSANTGQGHRSIANVLIDGFHKKGQYEVVYFDTFFEDCLISNRILSDFYNYLLSNSTIFASLLTEFTEKTRPDTSDDIYNASYHALNKLIRTPGLQAIVSTAPLINHNLIRILKENNLTQVIKFFIIITDPYVPIAPGFDCVGADAYFCFTSDVKELLIKKGVEAARIEVYHYPVSHVFLSHLSAKKKEKLLEQLQMNPEKKIVLINSGSYGNISFENYILPILNADPYIQIIFICGRNISLKVRIKKLAESFTNRTVIPLGFVDNLNELIDLCHYYIIKPGANTFFEALAKKKKVFINGVDGFLYQEKGIEEFLREHHVGKILYNYNDIVKYIKDIPHSLTEYQYQLQTDNIVKIICKYIKRGE